MPQSSQIQSLLSYGKESTYGALPGLTTQLEESGDVTAPTELSGAVWLPVPMQNDGSISSNPLKTTINDQSQRGQPSSTIYNGYDVQGSMNLVLYHGEGIPWLESLLQGSAYAGGTLTQAQVNVAHRGRQVRGTAITTCSGGAIAATQSGHGGNFGEDPLTVTSVTGVPRLYQTITVAGASRTIVGISAGGSGTYNLTLDRNVGAFTSQQTPTWGALPNVIVNSEAKVTNSIEQSVPQGQFGGPSFRYLSGCEFTDGSIVMDLENPVMLNGTMMGLRRSGRQSARRGSTRSLTRKAAISAVGNFVGVRFGPFSADSSSVTPTQFPTGRIPWFQSLNINFPFEGREASRVMSSTAANTVTTGAANYNITGTVLADETEAIISEATDGNYYFPLSIGPFGAITGENFFVHAPRCRFQQRDEAFIGTGGATLDVTIQPESVAANVIDPYGDVFGGVAIVLNAR